MKDWASAKEIAGMLGVDERSVRRTAAKGGWANRIIKAERGRPMLEFETAKLPPDVKERIANRDLKRGLRGQEEKTAPPAPEGRRLEGAGNIAAARRVIVPERSDAAGLAKYNLVHAWRELAETQPHGRKAGAMDAFLLAYNSGTMLPNVFAKVGKISESTLRKMDRILSESRAQNGGNEDYRALCDGRGGWRKFGTTLWRKRSLSNEAKDVFLSCWLRPEKPTVSMAIRATRMVLERKGIVEESDDRTWRRWLDDWSKRSQHIIVLAREGEKAYRDKIGPYITRDDSMIEPGQVLIADGHDLNFEILHPYTGRPARLKLVMFFDWASRMPAGWQIMPTESTVVIQAALRNALLNLGKLPQIVYLDNGRAFKAKVFTDTDPDLTELSGLYARLGIATQFSQPYNARAKVIERFFLTLNEQFERLMASYCGASIEDKPAWRARNEKFHRAQHLKRTGGWVPDIREAAWLLNLYIQWYGEQEHSGIHWQKPAEMLSRGRREGQPIDAAELGEQMLWAKAATPRRCRVTLFNIDYESDCLHGYGERIVCKYDCSDLSRVWFYALAGEYLGEGAPVQALNPVARLLGDQVGLDRVQAENERQRRLAKQTRQGLLELGAPVETADSLAVLPWREKAAVLPGKAHHRDTEDTEEDKPKEIDPEQRKRLELVVSNAEAQIKKERERGTRLERPENFESPASRYEWCWRARFEHKAELTDEEAAFMGWFETTAEYGEYAQRYEDLKLIYGE